MNRFFFSKNIVGLIKFFSMRKFILIIKNFETCNKICLLWDFFAVASVSRHKNAELFEARFIRIFFVMRIWLLSEVKAVSKNSNRHALTETSFEKELREKLEPHQRFLQYTNVQTVSIRWFFQKVRPKMVRRFVCGTQYSLENRVLKKTYYDRIWFSKSPFIGDHLLETVNIYLGVKIYLLIY